MRTRFLNINYFSPFSSEEFSGSFLHLPIPNLPPLSHLPDNVEDVLDRTHALPDSGLDIERLPIDGALSVFLFQVMPSPVHLDFSLNLETEKFDLYFGDQRHSLELDKNLPKPRVPRFEEPEPLDFLGSCLLSTEGLESFLDACDHKENLELELPKIMSPRLDIIAETELSRGEVDIKQGRENDPDYKVHECCDRDGGNFQCKSFPILEVDEMILPNIRNLLSEDLLAASIQKLELPCCHEYCLDIEDAFGCGQYGMPEFLSRDCHAQNSENDLKRSLDPINISDFIMHEIHLEAAKLFNFEEFKFFDPGSSDVCANFLDAFVEREPEECLFIFEEDEKSVSFNTLVVSRELTMRDDMFRSLPIPIISDDKKMRSFGCIFEEIIDVLRPLNFSASDEIYLDWKLLENEPLTNISSRLGNIEDELGSFSEDKELSDSLSYDKLVNELIFCNDAPTMITTEPYEDLPGNHADDSSRSFEPLAERKPGNSSWLFKSMSESNDLEFFMNPGSASICQETFTRDVNESDLKATNLKINALPLSRELPCSAFFQQDKMGNTTSRKIGTHISAKFESDTSSEAADEAQSVHTDTYLCGQHEFEVKNDVNYSEIIIVCNTRNSDKDMLVSRRNSYQKILEMEKRGAQLVERDLDLPVDIVLSCGTCLLWYDRRNIGKTSAGLEDALSSLPSCIENIATNVLTSLSFSFSSCILVFEGDFAFITTVMEHSDSLYVAAASLGIDLQLFCSYSSELTDYIITNSILCCSKIRLHNYSKLPESETLAESFLGKFPSINCLAALSMLAEKDPLNKLLCCESSISTGQKYNIPQESIALFITLCRFGERDDSKSIMTDCSSSISSGPGSDKCYVNSDNDDRKRRKCFPEDNIQAPNLSVGKMQRPRLVPGHNNCQVSIIYGSKLVSPSGLCSTNDGKTEWMVDSHSVPQKSQKLRTDEVDDLNLFPDDGSKFGYSVYKDLASFSGIGLESRNRESKDSVPGMSDASFDLMRSAHKHRDNEGSITGMTDVSFNLTGSASKYMDSQGLAAGLTNASFNLMESHSHRRERRGSFAATDASLMGSENKHRDHKGPVSDVATDFPDLKVELSSRKKSRTMRQLSFDETIFSVDGLNSDARGWSSLTDKMQSLKGNAEFSDEFQLPQTDLRDILADGFGMDSTSTSSSSFKTELTQLDVTPLSKAVHSSSQNSPSPWTIEFLNRVKEKSKLRKQHIPFSTPTPGSTSNVDRLMKRLSPSVIELFNNNGGATSLRSREKRKLDRSRKPSHSAWSARAPSASEFMPFTPLDKRAKQTLSFTKSGAGSQTRLVWGDGAANRPHKNFHLNS